jgi:hypothetical protein
MIVEVETFEDVRKSVFAEAEKSFVYDLVMRPLLLPTEDPIPTTLNDFIACNFPL